MWSLPTVVSTGLPRKLADQHRPFLQCLKLFHSRKVFSGIFVTAGTRTSMALRHNRIVTAVTFKLNKIMDPHCVIDDVPNDYMPCSPQLPWHVYNQVAKLWDADFTRGSLWVFSADPSKMWGYYAIMLIWSWWNHQTMKSVPALNITYAVI